jgi:hypothetical protein
VVTWGALGALGSDLGGLGAAKTIRWQQEAKKESKNENWWSKGGAPRGDEGRQGFGSAAWGRQMGDIGGSSWRVLGEDSARPDHAKAWGGGFKMPSAHAADLF